MRLPSLPVGRCAGLLVWSRALRVATWLLSSLRVVRSVYGRRVTRGVWPRLVGVETPAPCRHGWAGPREPPAPRSRFENAAGQVDTVVDLAGGGVLERSGLLRGHAPARPRTARASSARAA